MYQQYIPNSPVQYEKGLYLSRQTTEHVKGLLQSYGEEHYSASLQFLKEWVGKWKMERSPDGRICKATMAVQSPDQIVKINIKTRMIQVSFNNIPMIRESRWENLILQCEQAYKFPNNYLKICGPIVKRVCETINTHHTSLIYKAMLIVCDPRYVDEDVYSTLQSSKEVILQDDIENQPNINLEDDYHYIKTLQAQPLPQQQPTFVLMAESEEAEAEEENYLTVKDKELLEKLK